MPKMQYPAGISQGQALLGGITPYLQPPRQGGGMGDAMKFLMQQQLEAGRESRFQRGIEASQQKQAIAERMDRINQGGKELTRLTEIYPDHARKAKILATAIRPNTVSEFNSFLYGIPKFSKWGDMVKGGVISGPITEDELAIIRSISEQESPIIKEIFKQSRIAQSGELEEADINEVADDLGFLLDEYTDLKQEPIKGFIGKLFFGKIGR